MQLPSHFLPRPKFDLAEAIRDEFDALFDSAIRGGSGRFIDYSCLAPKWQFLCYLGDNKEVVLHGTGDPAITEFEPRQSNDSGEFGNQKAVYAASDGLWASYFAVVDRPRFVWSLVNSCHRVIRPDGTPASHYFFSVNEDALPHKPWRTGTIYVLPRDSFEQQHENEFQGLEAEATQWRSFVPVKPLAKISVEPEEFPFLDQVRGHDVAVINRRAVEDPNGYPWLED